MLKAELINNKCKVEHQGSPVDTAIEVAHVVSAIYTALAGDSQTAADIFRHAMETALNEESPVWRSNEKQKTMIISIEKR